MLVLCMCGVLQLQNCCQCWSCVCAECFSYKTVISVGPVYVRSASVTKLLSVLVLCMWGVLQLQTVISVGPM